MGARLERDATVVSPQGQVDGRQCPEAWTSMGIRTGCRSDGNNRIVEWAPPAHVLLPDGVQGTKSITSQIYSSGSKTVDWPYSLSFHRMGLWGGRQVWADFLLMGVRAQVWPQYRARCAGALGYWHAGQNLGEHQGEGEEEQRSRGLLLRRGLRRGVAPEALQKWRSRWRQMESPEVSHTLDSQSGPGSGKKGLAGDTVGRAQLWGPGAGRGRGNRRWVFPSHLLKAITFSSILSVNQWILLY